jgi:hypothetical protein
MFRCPVDYIPQYREIYSFSCLPRQKYKCNTVGVKNLNIGKKLKSLDPETPSAHLKKARGNGLFLLDISHIYIVHYSKN